MVIDNLDIEGAATLPTEADSPSLVDADTVLTFPISR